MMVISMKRNRKEEIIKDALGTSIDNQVKELEGIVEEGRTWQSIEKAKELIDEIHEKRELVEDVGLDDLKDNLQRMAEESGIEKYSSDKKKGLEKKLYTEDELEKIYHDGDVTYESIVFEILRELKNNGSMEHGELNKKVEESHPMYGHGTIDVYVTRALNIAHENGWARRVEHGLHKATEHVDDGIKKYAPSWYVEDYDVSEDNLNQRRALEKSMH